MKVIFYFYMGVQVKKIIFLKHFGIQLFIHGGVCFIEVKLLE